uniref:Uncharacterized protein n=1 Tax=Rhizophora mucronata TaxID=61149 RepID=A0A2P2QBX3_RHIMU
MVRNPSLRWSSFKQSILQWTNQCIIINGIFIC